MRIGDIVRLKSGGPRMTIQSLPSDYLGDVYGCVWIKPNGDYNFRYFGTTMVKGVK